ncbi:MAG: hypothetical protein WAO82_05035 [Limnohabitans sp.]|jgi:cell division protein FtsL
MQTLAQQHKFSSNIWPRIWPRFVACAVWGIVFSVSAQQAVYKCGQEITNQPTDPQRCERLSLSQPTQIEGTRVQQMAPAQSTRANNGPADVSATSRSQDAVLQPSLSPDPNNRKVQARTILEDEWQKLSAKYAELVHANNQSRPGPLPGGATQSADDLLRANELKVQLQRVERDMQALQRELSRHGKHSRAVQTQ